MEGFKNKVASSINVFVKKYDLNFFVNLENQPESLLDNLFKAFRLQKPSEKVYVIIDEYDHFANELLGFNVDRFKDLVSKNGKVRKWYEILKEGTESVVDRIFITGVAPITLDGMTSGFNIVADITKDVRFNEMMGFTKNELVEMMEKQEISKEKIDGLLPIMKQNYDGYKFSLRSQEKMYNSNMTLYFLNEYIGTGEIPERLVDVNIASDYAKIGRMLNLCEGEKRLELLEKTIAGEGILAEITEKFNPEIGFHENEMVSMLYYLGYLTINENISGYAKLIIPNKIMREIYSDFLLKIIQETSKLKSDINYGNIALEVLTIGKIDTLIEYVKEEYLSDLSNRDYQGFDEKHLKLIFLLIATNLKTAYTVKSEMEVQRKYPDLLLISKDKRYCSVIIEFKYLKKKDEVKLEEKRTEARTQLEEYINFDEIKDIENLKKYTVVAVNDEIYVDEL